MDLETVASRLQRIPEEGQPPADYPGSSLRPRDGWVALRKTKFFSPEVQDRINAHRRQDDDRLGKQFDEQQAELERIRASRVTEAHARSTESEEKQEVSEEPRDGAKRARTDSGKDPDLEAWTRIDACVKKSSKALTGAHHGDLAAALRTAWAGLRQQAEDPSNKKPTGRPS